MENHGRHEVIMARNMVSNHTDMQDKYCGHLFILALNRVNVVAVTTILVLHVGMIGHHVPCHYDFTPPVISDVH